MKWTMDGISKRLAPALGGLLALVTMGCAEVTPPPPSTPLFVFPSRADIAAIPAQKPRAAAFGPADTSAEPWTGHVEAKAEQAPYEDASPWGDFLRAAVKEHPQSVTLSAPLQCASEELAKITRSTQRRPAADLTRFLVARCGGVATSPRILTWGAEAPASVADGTLVEAARKKLGGPLEALFARADDRQLAGWGQLAVGLGVVRNDTGVSVVLTVGGDEVELESTPLRADAKHQVSIRGTAQGTYRSFDALVNQGAFGFAECQRQGDVAPPRFAFTCQLDEKDPYAWVEVTGKRPGLELSRVLASGIVAAGDDAPITFAPRTGAAPAVVSTPAQLSTALVDGVNRVRTAAHLAPLVYDAKQSAENGRLAGTLINAALADAPREGADRAAQGLLAGWDVSGMVRGATIIVGAFAPTRDANVWVDATLERPAGRATLLDPASRVIAVGPALPEAGPAVGAAVTTYALFDSDDHRREEATLYRRIDALRAARGLAPARFISGFPEMHEHAWRVAHEGAAPHDELQAMLTVAKSRSGQSAFGAEVETSSIERCPLPELVVRGDELHIAVAVTHHKVPGAAWGQYVVFFVSVEDVAIQQ
jgi:hypothetical protein